MPATDCQSTAWSLSPPHEMGRGNDSTTAPRASGELGAVNNAGTAARLEVYGRAGTKGTRATAAMARQAPDRTSWGRLDPAPSRRPVACARDPAPSMAELAGRDQSMEVKM